MIRRAEGPVAECVALFREGHLDVLIYHAWRLPPPDLADVLIALTVPEQRTLLQLLPPRLAARGLAELPAEAVPSRLLGALPASLAADLVRALDADDAARLLGTLRPAEREAILAVVDIREPIDRLLEYPPQTAGRMMSTFVIVVTESDPIALALESARRQAHDRGDAGGIHVVDVGRHLTGHLSFRQLVLAPAAALVRDVMTPVTHTVAPTESREAVLRRLNRYRLDALPVIDDSGRLLGSITADEGVHLAAADARATFLHFGGISGDEEFRAGWGAAVRSRLPTLYANLLTAFLAAAIVHTVTASPGRLTPLLVWLPIVAGMGGNAGIQALASAQYRLAQRRLPWNRRRAVLAREIAVGIVNGALIGAIVGGVAILVGESWRAGAVLTLAIVLHLPVAGALAAIAPMVLRRVGFDPSLASAPTIATLIDAIGMGLLLGLGALLL